MLHPNACSLDAPLRRVRAFREDGSSVQLYVPDDSDSIAPALIVPTGEIQKFNCRFPWDKPFRYCCQELSERSDSSAGTVTQRTRKPKLLQRCIVSGPLKCLSMTKAKNVRFATSQRDIPKLLNAFCQFCRPHTVFGTIIGITSVSLLPLESFADLSPSVLVGLLKALIPSIAMNIYVVGLNQLFDINIDKVNKPNLPLASGEFSVEFGSAIVSTVLLMSFTLGIMFQSPPLFSALVVSFILGSAYSVELPPFRWKRNPFLAAMCIVLVRGIVVQFAYFIHIQKYVLHRQIVFTRSMIFAVAFMCLFSIVIALFKDIPDVDGDRDFGIRSLSVRLGQEQVFWLCISTLLVAYGAAIIIGASSSSLVSKFITVLGHVSFAFVLLLRAQSVNLCNQASITSFYMFIWKLFYAEYLLIPLVR